MLAELWRDIAHPDTLADPDRCANVRHLTQFRVARILHEPAVADLRVGKHLRVIIDRAAHGTPVASNTSTQSLVVFVVSTAFITSSSASRFARRA
jgi:hypothetical protein